MGYQIDVIIPVYNAEATLEKCVESIVLGKYRNIEVILVEDRSADHSWEKCLQLQEKYDNVVALQNEKNSGVSYTRNHGLSKAESPYILFVDSDDWVSCDYAAELLQMAQTYPDSLCVCGSHFINTMSNYRHDYIWQEKGERIYSIERQDFFALSDKFHLQQLWNKIFRNDIIRKHHIQFDIRQSMGEDFQFVLDYMTAAEIRNCRILNRPLYYYIRANTHSLMSKFGLIENENEYKRLLQLARLTGEDNPEHSKCYQQAAEKLKQNYIYQACHSNQTKAEKTAFIEQLMKDGKADKYYRQQMILRCKENVASFLGSMRKLPARIRQKIFQIRTRQVIAQFKKKITVKDFSILSQNCIGGIVYHDLGMEFSSPTINLYFDSMDFIQFVNQIDAYLEQDLVMEWGEEFPIGHLGDITIYFMHYDTCREAQESWNRRKKRLNRDSLLILCTDMENFSAQAYREWQKITYPKLLFSAADYQDGTTLSYPEFAGNGTVIDLIPHRLMYKGDILADRINSLGKR